jgi:DNA-binding MarR family transcriptional regulator
MIADIERYTAIFNRQLRHDLKQELEPLGLNETNFFYLPLLVQHPGINQAYFITAIMREQSIVTKQINKLVKEGWIEKRISNEDRRQSELYPTQKALEIMPKIDEITNSVSQKSVAGLSKEEQEQFAKLLMKATQSYAQIILHS